LPQGGRAYQTALNAKFKIDRKRNVLSGSIEFRQPDSYTQIKTAIRPDLCKGFDIVDGVVAGNAFTFKTHITIRGVQVLTPWNGQLSATGAMVLEPLETLPCSEAPDRGFGFGPGSNAMVFHRAEPSGQAFEGKWWTREPGAIGVLELKADARSSAVTGVFENICREERKLAGTFNGKTLTLNTPANARDYGPTAWRVELIGDNTLRVAAEPPPQCMMERPVAFRLFPAG
jgi:hypothetical protein